MTAELSVAATRGVLWLGSANLLSKGSQIAVTLALGIFLGAEELGAVTIAVALLNLVVVLQLGGVYDVIAQTSEEPLEFAGTVATMSLAVSVVMTSACIVFASSITQWLGAPGAGHLLQVAAFSLPFSAYAGVQMAYLHRGLDFRRRLVPEAGGALTGAAVTVWGAALGWGAWCAVIGLVTTAILTPLLGLSVGVRIPLRASRRNAAIVVRWVSITGPAAMLGMVLLNVDYLIVSRVLGQTATGVYSFAFRIAFVPYVMGAVVIGAVSFPVCARLVNAGGSAAMVPTFGRFLHAIVTLTMGAYVTLVLLADSLVLIGPQWAASAPVLKILAAYGVLLSVILACHQGLRAAGRPAWHLLAQACHLVMFVGIALAWVGHGIIGVAWAQVAAAGVTLALVAGMLYQLGLLRRSLAGVFIAPVVAACAAATGHWLADEAQILPSAGTALGLLVGGSLVSSLYFGVILLVDRQLVHDLQVASGRRPLNAVEERNL